MNESTPPQPAPIGEPQVPPVAPAAVEGAGAVEAAPSGQTRAMRVGARAVGAVTVPTIEVPRFQSNSPFTKQQAPYAGQYGPSFIPASPGSHGTVVFAKPGGGHITYQG